MPDAPVVPVLDKMAEQATSSSDQTISKQALPLSREQLHQLIAFAKLPQAPERITWSHLCRLQEPERMQFARPDVNFKLGGCEQIAMSWQTLVLAQASGDQTTQMVDKKINDSLNLLINNGVIGALVLSVMVPLSLSSYDVADATTELFGSQGVDALRIVYTTILVCTSVSAVLLVYASLRYYTFIGFWLVSDAAKFWFINHISLTVVSVLGMLVLILAVATLPIGVLLQRSPIEGFVSLVGVALFGIGAQTIELAGMSAAGRQQRDINALLPVLEKLIQSSTT